MMNQVLIMVLSIALFVCAFWPFKKTHEKALLADLVVYFAVSLVGLCL